MTFKEFIYISSHILPIFTGIGCCVFAIWNLILCTEQLKLKEKLINLKYWINSIDKDELIKLSPHDARYLEEAKKILKDI